MKTTSDPTIRSAATRKAVKHRDGLEFVDQGRTGTTAHDLRERLQEFYDRYPLRTLKRGQRGIVESLKADRDRR